MLSIDSVKLKLNSDSIKDINLNSFNLKPVQFLDQDSISEQEYYTKRILDYETREEKTISVEKGYLQKDLLPFGVKSIDCINTFDDFKIILELSAKTLKENYDKSINKNTVDQLINNISSESISFKPENFYSSQVLKFDPNNNININKPKYKYIQALSFLKMNSRVKVDPYLKNNGIVITKNVKTKNISFRMSIYDKFYDMVSGTSKEMQEFINPEIFRNKLRIETNQRHFKQFRKYLNINTNEIQLSDLLNSNEKVNLKVFNEITKGYQFELFDNPKYENMNWNEFKNRISIETIIKECNFDINLIRELIKTKLSKNTKPSYQVKECKRIMYEMLNKEGKKINLDNSLIQEIRYKLAA